MVRGRGKKLFLFSVRFDNDENEKSDRTPTMATDLGYFCCLDSSMGNNHLRKPPSSFSSAYTRTRGPTSPEEKETMIIPWEVTGLGAAFGAGLITSLHCLGMCGPLACTACSSGQERENLRLAGIYHGSRVCAYIMLGAFAALVGRRLSDAFFEGATRWTVWIWIPFFLFVFLGWDRRFPFSLPARRGAWLRSLPSRFRGFSRATAMGFFTFLLPCLPLYWVLATAALSGSAWQGGAVMGAFGIGTIPLLFLAHTPFSLNSKLFSPVGREWIRRALAAAALVILVFRGTASLGACCH